MDTGSEQLHHDFITGRDGSSPQTTNPGSLIPNAISVMVSFYV